MHNAQQPNIMLRPAAPPPPPTKVTVIRHDIETLKELFTYGDATNTYLDIFDYLRQAGISEAEYSTWGKNRS